MPERIVTADQLTKEEEDFDTVFDNIVDKSDEDRKAYAEKISESDDVSGDTPKDQTPESDADKKPKEDPVKSDSAGQTPESDTSAGLTQDDWKAKAEQLESELQKERQRTSSWDGRIKAANNKVKKLEAEVEKLRGQLDDQLSNKKTEEEESDQEVMEKFKETFPELVDVISIFEKKLNVATANQAKDPEPSTTEDDLDPEPANSDDNTNSDKSAVCDMVEVRKAHSDVDEAVSSGKIEAWINTQPDYIKPSLENVYYGANGYGTTQQVIHLLNNFKNQTGWESSHKKQEDDKSAKLKGMIESEGDSGGPVDKAGPDKNDFDAAAKEAGLE